MRLFAGIGSAPLWYYERRTGLISVYDEATKGLDGWVGPDGYSKGVEKPARRFSGKLQMDLYWWPHRLVTTTSVHDFDGVSQPRLLFTAPEGETILQAR